MLCTITHRLTTRISLDLIKLFVQNTVHYTIHLIETYTIRDSFGAHPQIRTENIWFLRPTRLPDCARRALTIICLSKPVTYYSVFLPWYLVLWTTRTLSDFFNRFCFLVLLYLRESRLILGASAYAHWSVMLDSNQRYPRSKQGDLTKLA